MRILRKKYGTHFDTPFWELPEEIQDEVVYGTYENGKQSYCIERILRNAFEKGEDVEKVYAEAICMDCNGERIADDARNVLVHGKSIGQLGKMTLTALLDFLRQIPRETLSQFSRNVIKDVQITLENMIHFRLGHLSLYREMSTLSGGELQRLFLHLHLKSELNSLIYVFDEPMAGLHPSEKQGIMEAIKRLRDIGNTVIVVEHDKDMICQADHIIEIGPKAGIEGGTVTYEGDYTGYLSSETILSQFLSGSTTIPKRKCRKDILNREDSLILRHANTHYLKDVTVIFPLHAMVGVAGVSGSGKSSLIEETLLPRLTSAQKYGFTSDLEGTEKISSFVKISQEPIGRSSSSTPASYIGIWDKIRGLFAEQADAKYYRCSLIF